jgi:hypothetical protein
VESCTLLEPRGRSERTEKLRIPVAALRGDELRASTPVVERTTALPVLTIVARAMIRPRRVRAEI